MNLTLTSRRSRSWGFTLVDTFICTGLSSMLLLAVGTISVFSGRSLTALANYADLETQSRSALDRMTLEIRQALELKTFATNDITLTDANNQPLRYVYDPVQLTLTRITCTETNALLQGCDYLKFAMYQRNTTNGTFSQYVAGDASTCKLVEINWLCSRSILGSKVNTESVQSAKVVLRNK